MVWRKRMAWPHETGAFPSISKLAPCSHQPMYVSTVTTAPLVSHIAIFLRRVDKGTSWKMITEHVQRCILVVLGSMSPHKHAMSTRQSRAIGIQPGLRARTPRSLRHRDDPDRGGGGRPGRPGRRHPAGPTHTASALAGKADPCQDTAGPNRSVVHTRERSLPSPSAGSPAATVSTGPVVACREQRGAGARARRRTTSLVRSCRCAW